MWQAAEVKLEKKVWDLVEAGEGPRTLAFALLVLFMFFGACISLHSA